MHDSEALEQLLAIRQVVDEISDLQEVYDNKAPRDLAKKVIGLEQEAGPLPGVPRVFEAMPHLDLLPDGYCDATYRDYRNKKQFILPLAVAAVVSLLLSNIIPVTSGLHSLFTIAAGASTVALLVLLYMYSFSKADYKSKKGYWDRTEKGNQEALQKFYDAAANYEQQAAAGVEKAKEYGALYRKYYGIFEEMKEDYLKNREMTREKLLEKLAEFRKVNFIPDDYLHLLPDLITILQSGRADSYKEALNLAISEEREEKFAERRAEEERQRTLILERQAMEADRHNREMERQQEEQNRRQEEYRKQQSQRQEEDRRRQERDAAQADSARREMATKRCRACANNSSCRVSFSMAGESCGGFVPRR